MKEIKKSFTLWDFNSKSRLTVEATRKGKEWMALCPKHDDTKPSLAINEDKQSYFCHACRWKGFFYNPDRQKKKLVASKVPLYSKIFKR